MSRTDHQSEREQLIRICRKMHASELGVGSSGNVSRRVAGGMLITPTGTTAEAVSADQLVLMTLGGETAANQLRPSSEWLMHADVYARRPQVGGVVHCHSRHATTLACAQRTIPAVHYMIAATGTREIPLAPYATFGTRTLAANALNAMGQGKACLLAHHGQLTVGTDTAEALDIAIQVEELASIYLGCLALGEVRTLNDVQMAEVEAAFASYGQQDPPAKPGHGG